MNVERRKSGIHGYGVFARQPIEKGDWQCIYGELISCDDYWLESHCFEHNDSYMYFPYRPWYWLNHSSEPNCACEYDKEIDTWIIVALRDIEVGEELTFDYGYEP